MDDLDVLYSLLEDLADRTGGPRRLGDCSARSGWPQRGVYFFFEPGEVRPCGQPRVVRVGTHALGSGSQSTLWGRLAQHRGRVGGRNPGGGNHKSSIFRLHVGAALLARDGDEEGIGDLWGTTRVTSEDRSKLASHERRVSQYIGAMEVLCVGVDDAPGPSSHRGLIETGTIALLSGSANASADPPSPGWLGRQSTRPAIRRAGLWNVNHVDGPTPTTALSVLASHVLKG